MEVGELIIKTRIDNGSADKDVKTLKAKLESISKRLGGKFGTVLSKGLKKVADIGGKIGTVFAKTTVQALKFVSILGIGSGVIGLIVAGIMIVAKAFQKVFQENEQIKANLQYIVFAIGKAIEPAVNSVGNAIAKIVNLLIKAVQIIAYMISLLVGRNLFENATAEAFAESMKKAEDSTSQTAKNAKEIKKQLAGFDEMNVLSDNSDSGQTGGTATEVTMPTIDWSTFDVGSEKAKILRGILLSIAGTIAAMKLSQLLKTLGLIKGKLTFIKGLGIFGLIVSIYNIIKDLIDICNKFDETLEDNNTTLRDWGDVLAWVGVGIISLGAIILGLPAVVVGVIVSIIGLIMKYWDKIKSFFTDKVIAWLDEKIQDLEKTTIGGFFAQILRDSKAAIKEILNVFDGLFKGIKQIFDGLILIFKGKIVDGLWSMTKGLINLIISALNALIYGLNAVTAPIRGIIVAVGKVMGKKWNMDNIRIPSIPYLAKGGIINQPGRGVPIGSAYAGERGQEGVIPLTDSQQMALLGEAIGKYININATVPVYVGNRMVAREIKRINAEDNFAYNR